MSRDKRNTRGDHARAKRGRPRKEVDEWGLRLARDLAVMRLTPVRAAGSSARVARARYDDALEGLRRDLAPVAPSPERVVVKAADLLDLCGGRDNDRGAGVRKVAARLAGRAFGVSESWLRRLPQERGLQRIGAGSPVLMPPVIESDPLAYVRSKLHCTDAVALRSFARAWNAWMRRRDLRDWRHHALALRSRGSGVCEDCLRAGEAPALCAVHAAEIGSGAVLYCEWCAERLTSGGARVCSPRCRAQRNNERRGR